MAGRWANARKKNAHCTVRFPVDFPEQKENMAAAWIQSKAASIAFRPHASTCDDSAPDDDELEREVDQAIATCGGDLRAIIRALIVANKYLECEVGELMKAVSHAHVRGRFHSYSG
jgi:hypothetical protein